MRPRRDIGTYLSLAREHELRISHVLETHRQEDFEYGSAALADKAEARIVTGRHELFGRSDLRLGQRESIEIGTTRIVLLETPGHTPESVCYAVYPADSKPECWGVFTGDTLFVGATGRTDLSDPARTGENAAILYDSVHEQLSSLDGGALVLAAHGSGSACGSNIADRDDSTIGIERATNPVFTKSRAEFIREKCLERLPRPPYFSLMERVNLQGGRPMNTARPARMLPPGPFQRSASSALVIDTREPDAFAACHIPGSYNIWLNGLPTFVGWIAGESASIALVTESPSDLTAAELSLARVGLNPPAAALAGGIAAWRESGFETQISGATSARECAEWLKSSDVRLLDVRDDAEWDEGHIAGAIHTYVGELKEHLPRLDKHEKLIVYCSVGHRAGLAVSILEAAGFRRVYNMLGGMKAWKSLDLPVDSGH